MRFLSRRYKLWLEETDGQGQGLTRDPIPTAGTQPAGAGGAVTPGAQEPQAAEAAGAAEAVSVSEAAGSVPTSAPAAAPAPQSQPAVRANVGPDE